MQEGTFQATLFKNVKKRVIKKDYIWPACLCTDALS